jgi:hypothetical protein
LLALVSHSFYRCESSITLSPPDLDTFLKTFVIVALGRGFESISGSDGIARPIHWRARETHRRFTFASVLPRVPVANLLNQFFVTHQLVPVFLS